MTVLTLHKPIHRLPPAAASGIVPLQAFVGPRGTMVNVFTAGRGIPVVALHCSGAQGQAFRGLLPVMDQEFCLTCPDLYGYGRSESLPEPQRLSLEDDADLVADLLRRFDRPVHLVGHGYGGAVALQVAADYNRYVASLSLYEPTSFHLLKPEFAGHGPALRQIEVLTADIRAAYLRGDQRSAARLFYDFCNSDGAFDRIAPQRQEAVAQQGARLWQDFQIAMNATLPPRACREIRMPAVLLSGTRSPGVMRMIASRLAALLPHARHAVLPELGHMAPLSHPDTVSRVIATFLRACEQTSLRRACA